MFIRRLMSSELLKILDFHPSSYWWMFPSNLNHGELDIYAQGGSFPLFSNLLESIIYATILNSLRRYLTLYAFEV